MYGEMYSEIDGEIGVGMDRVRNRGMERWMDR
jgi:hypothetical protein